MYGKEIGSSYPADLSLIEYTDKLALTEFLLELAGFLILWLILDADLLEFFIFGASGFCEHLVAV